MVFSMNNAYKMVSKFITTRSKKKLLSLKDKDPFHLEISPFVHFMVKILFHKSNDIYTALSFKILNDVAVCTLLDL